MRWALRRVLWIVPTLAMISVAVFWALSLGVEDTKRASGAGAELGARELPRFFNPEPHGVRELARAAVDGVVAGDARAEPARAELVRLGGAALPHVLPRLDSLDPRARSRVALALAPVAERMGVGSNEELGDPQAAVVFWTRFWQDRAIDFRPAVVKRAVRRLASRTTPGRLDDIRQLDTFALAELMQEMAALGPEPNVERARRLTAAAAHVTGRQWTIPEAASSRQARSVIGNWQRWWAESSADYGTLDGARRMLAMITETQYGRWATDAARSRFGTSASGEAVLDVMRARAPVTLWLLAAGLLGGYAVGIALGVASGAAVGRPFDFVVAAAAVTLAALPMATLASWLSPAGSARASFVAALAMIATSAALVSRHQRAASRVALDQEYARTARAFGASPLRVAFVGLRGSSAAAISLIGVDLPALISAAFVLEQAFELPGLGPATLSAVGSRDVAWLMAIALASATTVALTQIASDALLGLVDPRVRVALAERRGAAE